MGAIVNEPDTMIYAAAVALPLVYSRLCRNRVPDSNMTKIVHFRAPSRNIPGDPALTATVLLSRLPMAVEGYLDGIISRVGVVVTLKMLSWH